MMNSNSGFNELDALLAKPPTLSDRGFSERINKQIERSNIARRNLFLITGLSWLLLTFIASSPQAIYGDLATVALSLDIASLYSGSAELLQSLIDAIQKMPYTTIATAIISAAAVLGMAIRA